MPPTLLVWSASIECRSCGWMPSNQWLAEPGEKTRHSLLYIYIYIYIWNKSLLPHTKIVPVFYCLIIRGPLSLSQTNRRLQHAGGGSTIARCAINAATLENNYHMRVLFLLELASGHHTAYVNSCYIRWFLLKLALLCNRHNTRISWLQFISVDFVHSKTCPVQAPLWRQALRWACWEARRTGQQRRCLLTMQLQHSWSNWRKWFRWEFPSKFGRKKQR